MRCSSSLFHLAAIALVAVAVFSLQTATAPANATSATHPSAAPAQPALDFGDAPEGVLAYSTGAIGRFPTCMFVGPAAWVRHGFGGLQMAWFGPGVDYEPDGNGGFCPLFQPNDRDECFADGDAGLLMPQPFTLLGGIERPCPNAAGTPLGSPCQPAIWGSNVDIDVSNPMLVPGYVNVLFDWDQNGAWGQAAQCPPGAAPEHVLTNFVIPPGFAGPLSALGPPSFLIGPQPGFAWARFAITEQPVPVGWDGAGQFDAGESEDYLLLIAPAQPDEYDWGDAPDPLYPTLSASGGAAHVLTANGPVLGNRVDAEPDGQPDATATGDDLSNMADEDGVVFMTPLLRGQQACVSVLVKPAGPGGLLDAWVDFDLSGVWGDFGGEQIFAGLSLTPGLHAGLCFPVPSNAFPGPTFARFRLSTSGGLSPRLPAADGEVEDYQVTVEAAKWNQPPAFNMASPYPYCFWGWDEPSIYGGEQIVADDWKCQDRRPVTDVHWWGSYEGWAEQGSPPPTLRPAAFHLGIWTDIPAGPQSWSHPGQMIWETTVPWAATQEALVGCDFHSAQMQSPDTCFLYSYKLPREHWFYQDPTENRVYWLSIAARYPEGAPQEYRWGWKTRSPSVIDTAVRILAPTAPRLWDPFVAGEPIIVAEQTWDMAFALTTPSYDFGDAPDAGYRTVLASDGARHILSPGGPYMGMGVDTELDGQPNPLASGDDMTTTDDEDGVTLAAAWVVGQPGGHSVDLLQSPAGCYLNAWADFDRNGSWLDPGEQIATDALLTAGMTYTLSFAVPPFPAARPGITYARYRCSSQAGLSPTGEAVDGEVEDYRVQLLAPPQAPVVSISVPATPNLRLSWPKVTADIYGNPLLADGYRIYWDASPYWTPAPGSQWMSLWEPSLPNPVTLLAAHLGDPSAHHFYVVRAVYRDLEGNAVESADSNRVGEFEFGLVPGAP